jgi:5'-nucleotidase
MPDFLARGGDGLKPIVDSLDSTHVDLGQSRNLNFRDALIAYWQARPEALKASALGRIKIVKDACPAQ